MQGRPGVSADGEMTVDLAADGVQATVLGSVGARLGSLRVAGVERLVGGTEVPADALAWGCYPMAPWVGRLESARVPWEDDTLTVPADHGRHAIHGLLHSRPWTPVETTPTAAAFEAELPPSWPWRGRVAQRVSVSPSGLSVAGTIASREPMPAALGWHPWWRFDDAAEAELAVPAERVLVTDGELIATGDTVAVSGETDLRSGPALGSRRLDHTYIGLQGPVTLAWPDASAVLEPGPGIVAVHVFVTDEAVCVEPLSAWPNAHVLAAHGVTGTGLAEVAPGSPLHAGWRLRWRLRGSKG